MTRDEAIEILREQRANLAEDIEELQGTRTSDDEVADWIEQTRAALADVMDAARCKFKD